MRRCVRQAGRSCFGGISLTFSGLNGCIGDNDGAAHSAATMFRNSANLCRAPRYQRKLLFFFSCARHASFRVWFCLVFTVVFKHGFSRARTFSCCNMCLSQVPGWEGEKLVDVRVHCRTCFPIKKILLEQNDRDSDDEVDFKILCECFMVRTIPDIHGERWRQTVAKSPQGDADHGRRR